MSNSQKPLFFSVPVWLSMRSLRALRELAFSPHLCGHVRHIVFSALRSIEHENPQEHLLAVRDTLRQRMNNDTSLFELQFAQYETAYHASILKQKTLTRRNLNLKTLITAFNKFGNLEAITFDSHDSNIGFQELIADFGWFNAESLLTRDGHITLSTLIIALSRSNAKIRKFILGRQDVFPTDKRTPDIERIAPGCPESIPMSMSANAMSLAFCYQPMLDYVPKVFRHVRILKISETHADLNHQEVKKIATAIKNIIHNTPNLEQLEIAGFCSEDYTSHSPPIQDLVGSQISSRLQNLALNDFQLSSHEQIVATSFSHLIHSTSGIYLY